MSELRFSWGLVKLVTIMLLAFLLWAAWAMWLGNHSAIYAECMAHHSGRRAVLYCSLSMLTGGWRDYLTFAGQWLPLALFIGALHLNRHGLFDGVHGFVARRRARAAARRAGHAPGEAA